jgi:hypothetical protein
MNYQSKVFNTEDKVKRLIKLAKTGIYSAPRLAKIFACNKKTVFRTLEANRIKLPNLGRFKKRNGDVPQRDTPHKFLSKNYQKIEKITVC